MLSSFRILLLAGAAAGTAVAQAVDVPYGYGNVECNSASAYPFGRGNGQVRTQYIYDTSNFTLVGVNHPVLIHTVQLRCDGGATNAGGTHTSVNYRFGVANADHMVLTTSFDGNYLGGAPPFLPTGPVTVATGAGTSPNNYYVILSVTPFLYDPSLGNDLIIEISIPAGTFTGTAANTTAASVDLHFNAPDSRGARVFTTTALGATGTFQPSSAHAMKFLYTVPSGTASAPSYGTGCGSPALALAASARPLIGTTVPLVTSNVPGTAVASAGILSFTQHNPGLDLTGLGMPGCRQFVGLDSTVLLIGSPQVTQNFVVPLNPLFSGMSVFNQSASLVPGINPLGAIGSNGLQLLIGTL